MGEGVIDSGQRVDVGVADRRKPPQPPPDPDRAPHGWTWDSKAGHWRPKKRPGRGGRLKPSDQSSSTPPEDEAPAAADDSPDSGGGGWQAERDPEPARLREDSGRDSKRHLQVVREVPQEVKDDLAAMIGLLGMVILEPIARADPICGGAMIDNFERITDAAVPLIVRSPRVVDWMTAAGGLRDWVGLGIAFRPVLGAVWAHHVAHTVHLEQPEDGQPPQVREEDWSGYTAA
ncbi:hypothetical protein [Amycolatopsis alkalitolerans]|uniref:Uncharacterized protein n=1 Tax=Amycolatopsis alkalitolerans TaxID=2547244 RepID=A0A5C4LP69_9PSEU|nr:hypothetical protein [Amycolatopsis alkalitolerans]TNC19056.1 hypothetical protein FG385_32840 [Amycolatopsis alkalitolerans]